MNLESNAAEHTQNEAPLLVYVVGILTTIVLSLTAYAVSSNTKINDRQDLAIEALSSQDLEIIKKLASIDAKLDLLLEDRNAQHNRATSPRCR